jgi:RND family efflux transporter MFP subunit
VPVKTIPASAAEWPSIYEATGTVRARTASQISAKVMGYVREVRVSVGDPVRAGQVLIVLDDRDLDAAVRQAEAGLNEAKNAMAEADNAIASAKAQLDLAQVTYGRMKDLHEKNSISLQEWDEAQMKLKVAAAGHEMALAKRSQLQARIRQAEEALSSANIMKSYARIAAPFAGVVTDKRVEPGNLTAPGQPLLSIEQAGGYRLEVPVEESRMGAIRAGTPVEVTLEAFDRTLKARVNEVVPAVDPGSRAFTVKIDLPPVANLRSGMFGRARFAAGARRALVIPAGAVEARGQVHSVMVARDNLAHNRLVTLGARSGDQVEVLSGLSAGEQVIHPRPAGLADGAPVEVRP